jgi:hypothetical protein
MVSHRQFVHFVRTLGFTRVQIEYRLDAASNVDEFGLIERAIQSFALFFHVRPSGCGRNR